MTNIDPGKEVLDRYEKGLSRGRNYSTYIGYAADFIRYSEGNLDRETVLRYVRKLEAKGYTAGTINLIFRTIHTVFSRNKIDWPFRRGEAPQIREDQVNAPALMPDLVGEMIVKTREKHDPLECCFLALSTTYGLRREEMVNLTAEDVNTRDHTIHIATLKHGRDRTHVIPELIVPYLQSHDFSQAISMFTIFALWYRIEQNVGFRHLNQVGWHSIRRTLSTMLSKQLSQNTVDSFLRHKQRTSTNMAFRYSAIQFVGKEGTTTEVVGEAFTVDQDVFRVHPFLQYWEEEI